MGCWNKKKRFLTTTNKYSQFEPCYCVDLFSDEKVDLHLALSMSKELRVREKKVAQNSKSEGKVRPDSRKLMCRTLHYHGWEGLSLVGDPESVTFPTCWICPGNTWDGLLIENVCFCVSSYESVLFRAPAIQYIKIPHWLFLPSYNREVRGSLNGAISVWGYIFYALGYATRLLFDGQWKWKLGRNVNQSYLVAMKAFMSRDYIFRPGTVWRFAVFLVSAHSWADCACSDLPRWRDGWLVCLLLSSGSAN